MLDIFTHRCYCFNRIYENSSAN